MTIDIEISEVGLRDGLQSLKSIMTTTDKKFWIEAQVNAGIRELEVGAFVSPALLPQLADTAELVKFARTFEHLSVAVLVPNLIGAQKAVTAGAHKLTVPLSVSETHSMKNVNRTHKQMLFEIKNIRHLLDQQPALQRPTLEGSLSTAFGCTLEGQFPEEKVLKLAEALMAAGCDEVGLSDTAGYANPAQVKSLVQSVWQVVGKENLKGIHLHNTRGLGLSNALAAVDIGLTTLDSSLGGIGGCPFAPGASGNIVTEDLVFMLETMGLNTGIDLEKLLHVRHEIQAFLPHEEMYGFVYSAGLPLGFRQTIHCAKQST